MNYQDEKVNAKADSTTMPVCSSFYAVDLFCQLSTEEQDYILSLIREAQNKQ